MTVPNNKRKIVIESYLKGHNRKQTASLLNIKYTILCSKIDVFKKENSYEQKLKGGARMKKLNEEHINTIQSWIDDDYGITLEELKNKLEANYSIVVSKTTINSYISSFNYTLKRTTLIPARRNDKSTINQRAEYVQNFLQIMSQVNEDHIFFIDEVGFNLSMRTKVGRSLSGTPATHTVLGLRTRNISTCAAMCKNGLVKYVAQTQLFKTLSFSNFIDELLCVIENMNIYKAVFIIDNVPFHKHSSIKEKFSGSLHTLLYLPPYSPFLNPIKNLFSKWKTILRQRKPATEEELIHLIESTSKLITSEDCNGFYRNIFSFFNRYIYKEPIIDGN